mgnify:CR=1 FL=1
MAEKTKTKRKVRSKSDNKWFAIISAMIKLIIPKKF